MSECGSAGERVRGSHNTLRVHLSAGASTVAPEAQPALPTANGESRASEPEAGGLGAELRAEAR